MRVLLDECLPRKLKRELSQHQVVTVPEAGWASRKNGDLLRLAEISFDVFITIDQNIPSQQNLASFNLAFIVLLAANNQLDTLKPLMPKVVQALFSIQPGDVIVVS
ncbi:MAG: DUF5615 family PIN-like protein [Acidobacteria bacterium]|nr:DUF5615 family PIN-like protein [Acidobacteriota bacterium]